MNDKDMQNFIEILLPFLIKKLEESSTLKNIVRMKNAIVKETPENGAVFNDVVKVAFPYDTTSFEAINKTGETLTVGDTICLMYWVDLKNSIAMFKCHN